MVSLQRDVNSTAAQASATVSLAQFFELYSRKIAATFVPCGPSIAAIIGLELLDLFEVVLDPLLSAGGYLFTILLVVGPFVGGHTIAISLRPGLLVRSDLLFMFLVTLPTNFDPMGRIGPRPLVLGVFLLPDATILADTALGA